MGSAFYISPEMFQRTYTKKTDVWSLGVTLYVLIAGYPADKLQKAFNLLQSNKEDRVKSLPNIPTDLPASFYTLIEDMLIFRYKTRKQADELIKYDFVQFHKHNETEIPLEDILQNAGADNSKPPGETSVGKHAYSVQIKDAVKRHAVYLDFVKFERGVTTLLVTMLSDNEIKSFLNKINDIVVEETNGHSTNGHATGAQDSELQTKNKKLKICPVDKLITALMDMKKINIVNLIMQLPNAKAFQTYSYDTALIDQFMEQSKAARESLKALKPKGSGKKEQNLSAHGTDFFSGFAKKKQLKNFDSAGNMGSIGSKSYHH